MNKKNKMKSYDELRYSDDFMFGKVMEDRDLCRDVLECLLQKPIGELTDVQTQKELRYTEDGKPIRLDVYNEDDEGIVYDAEMENLNHKTVETHELPKRSRFYQGSIDVDFLNKGNSYSILPESNVLFICTFDPFKQGRCQYTFRERCDEELSLLLNDGTQKVFYNCTYKGDDISDNLRRFYDYVATGEPKSELTERIETAVKKARRNEDWRTQYMKEWVVLMDAKDEGREEERRCLVESMLKKGKTVEEIVDFCGYPYELVKSIEDELKVSEA